MKYSRVGFLLISAFKPLYFAGTLFSELCFFFTSDTLMFTYVLHITGTLLRILSDCHTNPAGEAKALASLITSTLRKISKAGIRRCRTIYFFKDGHPNIRNSA